jgi:ureidoglycolate hydrolase
MSLSGSKQPLYKNTRCKMIPIRRISKKAFAKYGTLLTPPDKNKVFTVVCGDKDAAGWRIGVVIIGPDEVSQLEAHPESLETFEPVSGTSVLLVSETDKPDSIEAFLLDQGVLVNKNIWHGLSVLSERAEVKVTENFEVASVFHKLKKPIDVGFA